MFSRKDSAPQDRKQEGLAVASIARMYILHLVVKKNYCACTIQPRLHGFKPRPTSPFQFAWWIFSACDTKPFRVTARALTNVTRRTRRMSHWKSRSGLNVDVFTTSHYAGWSHKGNSAAALLAFVETERNHIMSRKHSTTKHHIACTIIVSQQTSLCGPIYGLSSCLTPTPAQDW